MSYGVAVTAVPATRTERVYEMLRSELLNGVLHPGQKLKMVELTERFGVSQSVIREALTLTAGGTGYSPTITSATWPGSTGSSRNSPSRVTRTGPLRC